MIHIERGLNAIRNIFDRDAEEEFVFVFNPEGTILDLPFNREISCRYSGSTGDGRRAYVIQVASYTLVPKSTSGAATKADYDWHYSSGAYLTGPFGHAPREGEDLYKKMLGDWDGLVQLYSQEELPPRQE